MIIFSLRPIRLETVGFIIDGGFISNLINFTMPPLHPHPIFSLYIKRKKKIILNKKNF